MIGRLHYATIAISIALVAILLAVSLIFSDNELKPATTNFHKIDLNAPKTEHHAFSGIKNLDELVDPDDKNKQLNLLYNLSADGDIPDNPLLIIKPGHLQQTHLYQLKDQQLELLQSQSRFDFQSAPEFMGYIKAYHLSEIEQTPLYLNVNHYKSTVPVVELWNYATYNRVDNQYNQLFTAICFGIFLLLLVNSFFYLIIRRKEYLLYIFYNSAFLVFLMTSSGFIYQFPALSFLADNINISYAIFALSMFALYTFSQEFMATKEQARTEHKIINAFRYSYLSFCIIGLFLYPLPQLLIQVTNLLVLLGVPLYAWLVTKLLRKGNRQAFFFALAFALLILAAIFRVLTTFGLLPESFIFNHGFAIASLLEATIFTLGLADRVLQIKVQRDSAQKETLERTQAYELQKEFSTLLNKITQKLHTSKTSEYEDIVVKTFLKELSKKINFLSAAAVYQMDAKLHLYSQTQRDNHKYNKVIKEHSLQIKRLCDLNLVQRLEASSAYKNMFIIPVAMRRHEWSGLILEVAEDFHPTDSMLDFLQHYATELIRCLLNIESLRLIKTKAESDDLTHLLNRGAILERLEHQLIRAQRADTELSIAFIDVDNFKQINDTFGHEAGDRCLTNLSKLLLEELPESCVIGRYGGDEFLVIFPGISKTVVKNYLENIRERIIPLIVENQSCSYTLSIGISNLKDNTKDSLQLIREADKALYVSKNEGKNQINLA